MGRGGVASGGRMAGFGLAEGCGDGGVAGTLCDEASQPPFCDEASQRLFCDGGVAATGRRWRRAILPVRFMGLGGYGDGTDGT